MVFLGKKPDYSDVSHCDMSNAFQMSIERTQMGNWLLKCAVTNCPKFQMSSISSIVTSSEDDDTDFETDHVYGALNLPWDENYWHIKISHVVSPNEVWATLTKNAVRIHRKSSEHSIAIPIKLITIFNA